MVWIDVETTGLDTEQDALLEVAMLITDCELEPLAGSNYVIHWPDPTDLPMSQLVRKMHTDNGLLDECRVSKLLIPEIDRRLAALLRQQGIDGTAPICGSTVHSARAFVKRDLPLTPDRVKAAIDALG